MDASRLEHARDPGSRDGGDGSGLLVLYPISKDSEPRRGRYRVNLEAAAHVLGVGLVFPTSASEASGVDYITADLSSMEREEPTEEDEVDEDLEMIEE